MNNTRRACTVCRRDLGIKSVHSCVYATPQPGLGAMNGLIKKTIIILIVGFLLYYLFTRPGDSADFIQSIVDAIVEGFNQIVDFFERLAA